MRRFASKLAYKLMISYPTRMYWGSNMTLAMYTCWNLISIISNMETMIYLQRS